MTKGKSVPVTSVRGVQTLSQSFLFESLIYGYQLSLMLLPELKCASEVLLI